MKLRHIYYSTERENWVKNLRILCDKAKHVMKEKSRV